MRYLDRPDAKEFVRKVRAHIRRGGRSPASKRSRTPVDALLRKKVENAAVECVVNYYESKGYNCRSVEKDNVGWDFVCTQNEVKSAIKELRETLHDGHHIHSIEVCDREKGVTVLSVQHIPTSVRS
ncbi:MAG: hypothetical protein OXH09_23120 [Gammaproteobacteria bacterium]|nr:hypothetical protein [Gammaproteobacteria bacterium]